MGIFDAILNGTGDANRDEAIRMGLLNAGLALLQSRGKLFPALGQAGQAGLGAVQQTRDRQDRRRIGGIQEQMLGFQRNAAQREDDLARAAGQSYMKPEFMDNRDVGQPGEAPPQFDMEAYLRKVQGIAGPVRAMQERMALTPKRAAPVVGKAGDIARDPETGEVMWQNPAEAKEDEFLALMRAAGVDPASAEGRALLQQRLRKQATHSPPVNVSYGPPVAGADPQGNPVFFQPDKAGGPPSIIPGVQPPKKDSALTEAQAKAATFMSQMKAAEKELAGVPIDPTKLWSQVDVGMAGGLTNILASPAAQRARQAQEQWAEAFLRFKTGAAATKDEVILNVRTFFPQPGDSEAVIDQKRRAREQAAQDIAFAAGQKSDVKPAQRPQALPDPAAVEAELRRRGVIQ